MTSLRIHRLGRRGIKNLFPRNKVVSSDTAHIRFAARPGQPFSRFAVVVSRQVARKSAERNHLRRRVSGWLKERLTEIHGGFDAVLILGERAPGLSRRSFYSALEELFKKTPLI